MYPKTSDPNFSKKITKKYSKYKIPKKKRTFDQICFPTSYTLQLPQEFLAAYINPDTPYKKILIYHKIGGGKTCAAITIAEQFKNIKTIVVVLPAFLINNFRNELRSRCTGDNYINDTERQILLDNKPNHPAYIDVIEKSDRRIDKYYNVYSYNKFVEALENKSMKLINTILIIDEVQNMISEKGVYYEQLYKAVRKAPRDFRLVIMSGTPIFDKPAELSLTLNLLLDEPIATGDDFYAEYLDIRKRVNGVVEYKIKNEDQLKLMLKGRVSYYAGAPSYVFPKTRIQFVKCTMSKLQLRMYTYIAKIEHTKIDPIKSELTNRYYSGTRSCSNFAYPDLTHYSKMTDADFTLSKLPLYSGKYSKIINHVSKASGTIFIYSNFRKMGGLQSLARALRVNGFGDYATEGAGINRFAVWSGRETTAYRDLIRSVFNRRDNVDGSQIKIVLGSPSIREGVSLLRLSEIHIVEPYWNMSRIEQVMGRGIRFCSHADLAEADRYVDVYIYLSVHKMLPVSVDQKIMSIALTKKIINSQFEAVLKESAVDCKLFSNANITKLDTYKCDP